VGSVGNGISSHTTAQAAAFSPPVNDSAVHGMDASADAIARFEHDHRDASFGEDAGGGKAGDSGAHHRKAVLQFASRSRDPK